MSVDLAFGRKMSEGSSRQQVRNKIWKDVKTDACGDRCDTTRNVRIPLATDKEDERDWRAPAMELGENEMVVEVVPMKKSTD
jgi:hypothetical protein